MQQVALQTKHNGDCASSSWKCSWAFMPQLQQTTVFLLTIPASIFSQFQVLLGSSLPNGDDLADIQKGVTWLGNKEDSDHFIQRHSVHVEAADHWQHKAAECPINLHVLFTAFDGDGQSGGTLAESTSFVGKPFVWGNYKSVTLWQQTNRTSHLDARTAEVNKALEICAKMRKGFCLVNTKKINGRTRKEWIASLKETTKSWSLLKTFKEKIFTSFMFWHFLTVQCVWEILYDVLTHSSVKWKGNEAWLHSKKMKMFVHLYSVSVLCCSSSCSLLGCVSTSFTLS